MSPDTVTRACPSQALELALQVALPLLLVGLVVGLAVSIFQAVTQIQEQTLAFIPKILALAGVLVVGGPWMLDQLLSYTTDLWSRIPHARRMTVADAHARPLRRAARRRLHPRARARRPALRARAACSAPS